MGHEIGAYFGAALGRITGFLPNLISGVVILAIGYVLSRLAGSMTRRLCARMGLDRFASRHLHAGASAPPSTASATAGATVFWLGILVTVSLAANTLGLYTLSAGIDRIIGFVPRLLVAVVIIAAALALSRLVAGLVGGALAKGARAAIVALAAFMALDEIGIAHSIVLTMFTAVLGAAAVAAAIAFGIGNIGLAGEASRRWALHGRAQLEERRPLSGALRPGEPPEAATH
jgi:hypothetical protein